MREEAPSVIVHSLAQALAACRLAALQDRPLRLQSGGYLGWATWQALLTAARAAVPAARVTGVYDPDGRGGHAAEALRDGAEIVLLAEDHPQHAALSALATACGGSLGSPPAQPLDLAGLADPEAALRALFAGPFPPDAGKAKGVTMDTRSCGLYLVTPTGLANGALPLEDFAPLLESALDAGAVEALLLRTAGFEGERPDTALAREIERLLPLAHARGVPLVLEERADLAAQLGCDGVHLAARRTGIVAVRKALGPDAIVGAAAGGSRHDAMEAADAGADYVTFGFFDPEPQPPDPELLEWWQEVMQAPAVAMGGITLENAAALAAAGADFLALRNAVWSHPQGPAKAIKAFAKALAAR